MCILKNQKRRRILIRHTGHLLGLGTRPSRQPVVLTSPSSTDPHHASMTPTVTASNRSVSVLGLGDLGSALARALIAQGWNTTVWNRSAATRCAPLLAAGARVAASADECVAASLLVVACLTDTAALNDLLEKSTRPESSRGRILVNYSAGTMTAIERCAQLATSELEFSTYIHAPIFATPPLVGHPDTRSYYGGNEEAYRSVKPILTAFGQSIYLGRDPCSARFQEILMGGCFYGFASGFLQTMATLRFSRFYTPGAAQRLMADMVTPLLTHSFPGTFGHLAKQIDGEYVVDGDGVRLGLLTSALRDRVEIYRELGLSDVAFRPMMQLLQARLENGGSADEEMSSLVEVIADPASLAGGSTI